jgi:hypothetical protein
MSWLPLREFLRADLEAWVDDLIRHDPDPAARACLAAHREHILERLTDQAEVIALRQFLAKRDQTGQQDTIPRSPAIARSNGTNGHRCIKVNGR